MIPTNILMNVLSNFHLNQMPQQTAKLNTLFEAIHRHLANFVLAELVELIYTVIFPGTDKSFKQNPYIFNRAEFRTVSEAL